ncbi:hypothetical protein [Lyngbya confervoides]|uniref:Uncharacterized protein n=1 Tax=Lyngbya confervoides BDU141951 TaxID=1574623 RepID=A0ABD4T3W5_9CYAN|nr:hypothetical protein [Lyngbya confervoides]MCM1983300.1 hypothetical protein [Lyngbya confervoides BDU141951]
MSRVKTITRQDLLQAGATAYLVKLITHSLHPIAVQDQQNIYALNDVISAVRHQLRHPRTRPQTQLALEQLLSQLISRLDNVIEAPFGKKAEERIGFHIDRILGRSPSQKPHPSPDD